jgi:hypothetical protein
MTLSDFNTLQINDQLEATWEKGVLEDNVANGTYHYLLYKLDDFFVEITFNSETDDVIALSGYL